MTVATQISMQEKVRMLVERSAFTNTILGVIIFNAITLGMSTSPSIMTKIGGFLIVVDNIVL
ncbi:MAG: voltage-gated sodium channel, partial [Paracoccaceae bacterium]